MIFHFITKTIVALAITYIFSFFSRIGIFNIKYDIINIHTTAKGEDILDKKIIDL